MTEIYKVTAASIGTTKRGYKVYRIQLNNSFLATKLVPFSKTDKASAWCCKLYQLYTKNNESLSSLVGKYISAYLSKTKFGMEFYSIDSVDVMQDFKSKLDHSKGKSFWTKLPIYEFLSNMQRAIEPDGSIKLSSDFGDMRISKRNVCYQYDTSTSNEHLNINNIDQIFGEFYKDKTIDETHIEKDSEYTLSPYSIQIKTTRYRNTGYKNKPNTTSYSDVLIIGDRLSEEQHSYLLNLE